MDHDALEARDGLDSADSATKEQVLETAPAADQAVGSNNVDVGETVGTGLLDIDDQAELGATEAPVCDEAEAEPDEDSNVGEADEGASATADGGVQATTDEAAEANNKKEDRKKRPEVDEPVTTLMIRNVPHNLKQSALMSELDKGEFRGTYDFCYMPCSFETGEGKGYCFVNFLTPEVAAECQARWNKSRRFNMRPNDTALSVSPAVIQGLEANVAKWSTPRLSRVRNPDLRPFILNLEDSEHGQKYKETNQAAIEKARAREIERKAAKKEAKLAKEVAEQQKQQQQVDTQSEIQQQVWNQMNQQMAAAAAFMAATPPQSPAIPSYATTPGNTPSTAVPSPQQGPPGAWNAPAGSGANPYLSPKPGVDMQHAIAQAVQQMSALQACGAQANNVAMQAASVQAAVAMQAATVQAAQAAQAHAALLQAGVQVANIRPELPRQLPQQEIVDETTVVVTDIEHQLSRCNDKTWRKWLDDNGYAGSYASVKYYDAKVCNVECSSLLVRFLEWEAADLFAAESELLMLQFCAKKPIAHLAKPDDVQGGDKGVIWLNSTTNLQ